MPLNPLDIPAGFYANGTDLEGQGRWKNGSLVRWLDGSLRPIGGWRQRVDSVTKKTIRGMHSWQSNDKTAWLACGSYKELVAVSGGGGVYDITPDDLVEGRDDGGAGTGYGAGNYGQGIYGIPISPKSDAIPLPSTTWDLDNFGEILIACSVDDGNLWEWDLTTTVGSELATNGDFATDSDWTKGNGGAGGSNWVIENGVAKYLHYKPTFDASDDAVVSEANDTITITGHRFEDGDEVIYNVASSPAYAIGGLTDGNTYYIVSKTANTFKLSATSGGTAIDLTFPTVTVDADDAAVVVLASDKVVIANTFTNGDYVVYNNGGGADIGGLVNNQSYYIVSASASEFKLAATSGGTAIDLTAKTKLTFDADGAGVVDYTNNKIVQANTFSDGDEVLYDIGGGTAIGGLTDATNYFVVSSSASEFSLAATSGGSAIDLTAPTNATIDGEDTAVVDVTNDKFVVANSFTNGDEVVYSNGGGTDIGGLTDGSTYYIISASASEFQLSTTSGGTAVTISAIGAGFAHTVTKQIGATHSFEQDIGSSHTFTANFGANHNLDRQNYGNLEQTMTGLENARDQQDTHDITVTVADLDDPDHTDLPAVKLKVTGTTSTTVLVDEELVIGANRFRFGTDDTSVKVEIIPNDGYDTSDFSIDDISMKNYPVAEVIDNAPQNNLGVIVTEERFIFALGAENNARKIKWCDREDRDQWTPAATNEAGDIELQTSGQILCAAKTRGSTVIITDFDCHQATYIGPPYVYSFQRVGSHCGAVSRKSAVSTDRGVFWYGQENFFMFDGNTVQVVPCDVHDYVFGDFNIVQQSKVWGMVNGTHQEIWWFYPSGGSVEVDRYVAYDFMENHWLVGELSRTAGVSRGVFQYPIMAKKLTDDTDLMDHEIGHAYDSESVFAETGPISLGAGDRVQKVTRVIPDEKTQGDVQMTFKTRFHPNDTERSYGPFDPTNPTGVRFTGRQIRMRVEQDQDVDWRVGIMRLETKQGGTR